MTNVMDAKGRAGKFVGVAGEPESGGLSAHAQQRANRNSDRQVGPILQRIETRTQAFRNSIGTSLDQSRRNDARREESINEFVSEFGDATARFRERYDDRQAVAADAQELIDCASSID